MGQINKHEKERKVKLVYILLDQKFEEKRADGLIMPFDESDN